MAPPPPGFEGESSRVSGQATGSLGRPKSKPPPPPPKPVLQQTSVDVHPQPHSPSSPYYIVPPPYSVHPPRPTRPAPAPPGPNGAAKLPKRGAAIAQESEPEVITPQAAQTVRTAVRRPPSYAAKPEAGKSSSMRRGKKPPEEIEMVFVDGRADADDTATAALLHESRAKNTYDPEALPPPDFFILSVITCLCCCFPIGLVALIFSICSSNASGTGKVKRGRLFGNIALVLCILGCLAAVSTALALYFTGKGEELFYKIKDLIVNSTTPEKHHQQQKDPVDSRYDYDYGQGDYRGNSRNDQYQYDQGGYY